MGQGIAMPEVESRVAANYGGGAVLERVLGNLRAAGKDPDAITPEELKQFDSLHIGGWEATEHLLDQLAIAPGCRAVDLGCGIGGATRTLAARFGAEVVGVDLTPGFVAAAKELSRRAGVIGVAFVEGSVTALPFEAGQFDLAIMLHVGMNVADKPALFAEAARVLRSGGWFAVYDVMRVGEGAVAYPMPWAGTPEISFVEAPDTYAALAAKAGFRETARRDRSEHGIAFLEAMRDQGPAGGGMPPDRLENVLGAMRDRVLAPTELILCRE